MFQLTKTKSKMPKFGKKAQFMSWCIQYIKDGVPFSSIYTMALEKKKFGTVVGLEVLTISNRSVSHFAISAPVYNYNIDTILNSIEKKN